MSLVSCATRGRRAAHGRRSTTRRAPKWAVPSGHVLPVDFAAREAVISGDEAVWTRPESNAA